MNINNKDSKPKLVRGNYYYLTTDVETTLTYYYYNPDDECEGFGFNTADGGNFLRISDLRADTTITEAKIEPITINNSNRVVTTVREILAAFAYSIVRSSPYPSVTNLPEILEAIRQFFIKKGFADELEHKDKYATALYFDTTYPKLSELFDEISDNVPEFNRLNLTKMELDAGITDPNSEERTVKFAFASRYGGPARDRDFIDLDACTRNVLNMIN